MFLNYNNNLIYKIYYRLDDSVLEIHAINSILVKRLRVHKEKVNNITKLNEPVCYITCSADKTVKIWSMNC